MAGHPVSVKNCKTTQFLPVHYMNGGECVSAIAKYEFNCNGVPIGVPVIINPMGMTIGPLPAGAQSGYCDTVPQITSPSGDTYIRSNDDEIIFVVNGVQIGQAAIVAGTPKWTFDGILDPIVYAGTPRTISQRNAIASPQAGYFVYVHDGATKEYQYFDGTQWVSSGANNIFGLQGIPSPVGQAGSFLTINSSENGIEYTQFVDAFNQPI